MTIHIPADVQHIIDKLEEHGHSAYIVGGCVRDAIMGKMPHDYDICTSALPNEVLTIFQDRKVIETGLKHGTVTVQGDEDFYEVTTYRIDGEYEDSRHPKEVVFTSDLLEDLKRRDFTINAMAYNHLEDDGQEDNLKGLVDAFEGIKDLQEKKIRCVGNPIHRFEEDALRMMRAVRFSAQLGYEIEEETAKAL